MLEFLGRPGVTEKAFRKRYDTLRKLTKDLGVGDKSVLLLDMLAHETVLRLIDQRKQRVSWDGWDLDFSPEDE
jgi:hypothetical protein